MLNKIWQIVFRCAYRLALCYWFIVRPRSTGVVVAGWGQDRVLLVKNSYPPLQAIPGGGIKRNEDVRTAAARELREEVGIIVEPNQLHLVGKVESDDRYLKNTSTIFEFFFKEPPVIKIDCREIIDAQFISPSQALQGDLRSDISEYLSHRSVAHV